MLDGRVLEAIWETPSKERDALLEAERSHRRHIELLDKQLGGTSRKLDALRASSRIPSTRRKSWKGARSARLFTPRPRARSGLSLPATSCGTGSGKVRDDEGSSSQRKAAEKAFGASMSWSPCPSFPSCSAGHRGHGRWELGSLFHEGLRCLPQGGTARAGGRSCLRALSPGVMRRDRLLGWVPVFPGGNGLPGGPTPAP